MAYRRPYMGYEKREDGTFARVVFRADSIPTRESHGDRYAMVVGPFRTMRGARFMRDYGNGNPHCNTVSEAERLAKLFADLEAKANA